SGRGRVPELPCAVANDQGKALGELRTATETASGWHGVAMLKSRFVEGGLTLELDGREATVEKAFMGKMQEDDGA
ncbi:MAG TPA: hypothetical protein VJ952_10305, partial [Opitutales bacterium]|nr:hypothetical protein [Opitutales bacterium]